MLGFKKKTIKEDIIKKIYKKDIIVRYVEFIAGVFLTAIAFNIFVLPNDLVFDVTGIAVIFKQLCGWTPSLVILISSLLLLIMSFIFLGYEKTRNTIIGTLLLPLFVELTEPLIAYVNLGNTEPIVLAVFGAVLTGIGSGLTFKTGYTTGGTDILNQIVAKYGKMSLGNSMFFTDGLIVFASLFVFGWQKFMYSVVSIYIISMMTDKVVIGISKSKAFYIITTHETDVKRFLTQTLGHGVTILEARGGYTGNNTKVIMCIIPTKEYFVVKEGILNIDNNAFTLITDAYEAFGNDKTMEIE